MSRHKRNPNGVLRKDGYLLIYSGNHPKKNNRGYVLAHVKIFEDSHKCCLLDWANIHHINGIKHDNRVENLQGMTRRQHSIMESPANLLGVN